MAGLGRARLVWAGLVRAGPTGSGVARPGVGVARARAGVGVGGGGRARVISRRGTSCRVPRSRPINALARRKSSPPVIPADFIARAIAVRQAICGSMLIHRSKPQARNLPGSVGMRSAAGSDGHIERRDRDIALARAASSANHDSTSVHLQYSL